jgi:ferredoxin-NADP reductase
MATITTGILGVNKGTTRTSSAGAWRIGKVTQIVPEAVGLRSYTFAFDSPVKHDAGQHYEIRLTAEDGYQAARLYSAAMPANGSSNMLQLTIALMPYGEVSPYIFNYLKIGDQVEIRGPLGRYFVWTPGRRGPVLLVGGGTGVIPLRCMRLEHQQSGSAVPLKLLYSVRTYYDMPYKYELFPKLGQPMPDVAITFTEQSPDGWKGYRGRINSKMLRTALLSFPDSPRAYVCGPTPFVESVTRQLVKLGLDSSLIAAERFGPTS